MMISVSSSLSALRAYGKRMGVHANNVANMHSKGFVKSRVLMKEGLDQTVTAEIDRVEVPMLKRETAGENNPVDVDPGAANAARDDFQKCRCLQRRNSLFLKCLCYFFKLSG
jgi:flagellar basal body rod protein FlgG